MSVLIAHKVVDKLPDTLDKNAVYAVRTGRGFDLYISDATGSVAHRPNTAERIRITSDMLDMANGYPFSPQEIPFTRTYDEPPLVKIIQHWHTAHTQNAAAVVYQVTRTGFKFRTNAKRIFPGDNTQGRVDFWAEITPQ